VPDGPTIKDHYLAGVEAVDMFRRMVPRFNERPDSTSSTSCMGHSACELRASSTGFHPEHLQVPCRALDRSDADI